MKRDIISIKDLSTKEILEIFNLTDRLKRNKTRFKNILNGKTLALIFQKPSNRTRVSFEVGMYQLGGNTIYLSPSELHLGVRETIKDVAKTLSRYVDCIVIRTFEHANIIELAKHASVPVINGLSDLLHPCQALADIYTIKEKFKSLKNITVAYIGDGNNVCHSLLYGCSKVGISVNIATPREYAPSEEIVKESKKMANVFGANINLFHQPQPAVKEADVIYTDVWVSMGQEPEREQRIEAFKDFQINLRVVNEANKKVIVMHCLPAHRGEEITDEVIDGEHSVVFDQAENRMHVQKAILIKLLKAR